MNISVNNLNFNVTDMLAMTAPNLAGAAPVAGAVPSVPTALPAGAPAAAAAAFARPLPLFAQAMGGAGIDAIGGADDVEAKDVAPTPDPAAMPADLMPAPAPPEAGLPAMAAPWMMASAMPPAAPTPINDVDNAAPRAPGIAIENTVTRGTAGNPGAPRGPAIAAQAGAMPGAGLTGAGAARAANLPADTARGAAIAAVQNTTLQQPAANISVRPASVVFNVQLSKPAPGADLREPLAATSPPPVSATSAKALTAPVAAAMPAAPDAAIVPGVAAAVITTATTATPVTATSPGVSAKVAQAVAAALPDVTAKTMQPVAAALPGAGVPVSAEQPPAPTLPASPASPGIASRTAQPVAAAFSDITAAAATPPAPPLPGVTVKTAEPVVAVSPAVTVKADKPAAPVKTQDAVAAAMPGEVARVVQSPAPAQAGVAATLAQPAVQVMTMPAARLDPALAAAPNLSGTVVPAVVVPDTGIVDSERGVATAPATLSAAQPGLTAAVASGAPQPSGADTLKLNGPASQWQEPLRDALGERLQTQIGRNSEHALIRLDPPNLGRIEISIRHSGGALQVNLSASNNEVLRQLQGIGETVRNDLAQRQFSDVAVTVSATPRGAAAQNFAEGDARQRHQGRQQDQDKQPGRALSDAQAPSSSTFALYEREQ